MSQEKEPSEGASTPPVSKAQALKDKLAGLRAQLSEKTDKIGFLRAWRERRSAQTAQSPHGPDPHALSTIYREGSTVTRLQVLAFWVFVIVAVVSAGSLVRKIALKMRSSAANEQMKKDFSSGVAEVQRKKTEEAELLALGQFTTNIYVGPPDETKMMNIDLWIRVSDPAAAATVNNRNEVFREKTMDALNALFTHKVNLLQESGKAEARERIRDSLNATLKGGKVEEVFIQNLVVE